MSCMMSGVFSFGKRACVAVMDPMPTSSVLGSSRIDLVFNIVSWLALRLRLCPAAALVEGLRVCEVKSELCSSTIL